MTSIIFFILFWAICGFIAYGLTVYHFQINWPAERRAERLPKHRHYGLVMALCGPFGLLNALLDCLAEWRIGFRL